MYTVNKIMKKIILKIIKAAAKGPSFLNQKTVDDLWYEKWSLLGLPHDHLFGS